MFRKTYVEINLSNIKHNLRSLKANFQEDVFVCPMLKANAYGHGDIQIARACEEEGVSAIGVVCLEEALHLKEASIKSPILIFSQINKDMFPLLLDPQFIPVVSDFSSLDLISQNAKSSVKVHIKLNTGMNRLGFRLEQMQDLHDKLQSINNVQVEAVCTHLLAGEDLEKSSFSKAQIECFEKMLPYFQDDVIKHLYKSSASLLFHSQFHEYGLRPGISLYGVYPDHLEKEQDSLKPVLSWKTQVGSLQKVPMGESVSYGARWTAQRDSIIAVLPVGYSDAYPRCASNKAKVIIDSKFYPQVGSICMDYMMVDVTDHPDLDNLLNTEVTLIGQEDKLKIGFEDLANWSGRIPYEIMTSLSSRLYKVFKD